MLSVLTVAAVTAYVTNGDDGTVSVIDEDTNEEVAKVSFNVEPFNTGHIEYNRLITPVRTTILFVVWF